MTEMLTAIRRSDEEITALASRTPTGSTDPLLQALEAWAAEIDGHPLPDVTVDDVSFGSAEGRTAGRVASRSLALAVALTLSSTGVAAAVKGDPWAPINFVVTKITTLGQSDEVGAENVGLPAPDLSGKPGDDRDSKRPSDGKKAPNGQRGQVQAETSTQEPASTVVASKPGDDEANNSTTPRHRPAVPVVNPADDTSPDKPPKPDDDQETPHQSPKPPALPTTPDSPFPEPKPGTDPPPVDTD